MATLKTGDVVVADFSGVTGVKRRPVVVSTDEYHSHRPDVILGAMTMNLAATTTSMNRPLNDWAQEGLHRRTTFPTFLVTVRQRQVLTVIGHLSDADWAQVQDCWRRAIAI